MNKQITTIEGFDFQLDFEGLEKEVGKAGESVIFLISSMLAGMFVNVQDLENREIFIEKASVILEEGGVESLFDHVQKTLADLELKDEDQLSVGQQLKFADRFRKTMPQNFRDLRKNLYDFVKADNLSESIAGYTHTKAFKRLRALVKENVSDDQIITVLFSLRNPSIVEGIHAEAFFVSTETEEEEATEKKEKKETVKASKTTKGKKSGSKTKAKDKKVEAEVEVEA